MPHRANRIGAFAGFLAGLLAVASLSGNVATAIAQPKLPAIVAAPQAPSLNTPANLGAKAGERLEITLTGTNLNDPVAVQFSCPARVTIPTDNKNGTEPGKLRVTVELPADCPPGLHTFRVATRHGVSNFRPFVVDELAATPEADTNHSKETAQAISVPAVVTGRTDAETSDYFRFKANPGQTLTFEVLARRIGSPLDPVLALHDAKTKRELVSLYADDTPGLQSDCRLVHTFKDGGEFLVEVRDSTYRGGADFFYRLRIGEFPGVTTAFPLAVQRGQAAKVGFAGPGTADIPAVSIKAPTDPTVPVVYVAPRRPGGLSGWPVPVKVNDWPETTEQEPNDDPSRANTLTVPGGVSARFEKAGDVDHFVLSVKKGVKYAAVAETFEINSPCEVLLRVLDPKGAEVARSNPSQPVARVEFTPAADGNYVIACEQLNYLSGPNEIYHLVVRPVLGDFSVTLSFDRGEAPAGHGTAVAATVTRLNGFTGPVELSIAGDPALSGAITVPPGQSITFVPLLVKAGTPPGTYPFRVRGQATIDGQTITRFGTLTDPVKAALAGMPVPPEELLTALAVAVIDKPPFALKLGADPATVEKGKASKAVIEVSRDQSADGDIGIAPFFVPANISPAATKGIPKGSNKTEVGLTVAPAASVGPNPVVFRASTKVAGKDYALIPPPLVLDVTEAKKDEAKKDKK